MDYNKHLLFQNRFKVLNKKINTTGNLHRMWNNTRTNKQLDDTEIFENYISVVKELPCIVIPAGTILFHHNQISNPEVFKKDIIKIKANNGEVNLRMTLNKTIKKKVDDMTKSGITVSPVKWKHQYWDIIHKAKSAYVIGTRPLFTQTNFLPFILQKDDSWSETICSTQKQNKNSGEMFNPPVNRGFFNFNLIGNYKISGMKLNTMFVCIVKKDLVLINTADIIYETGIHWQKRGTLEVLATGSL